MKIQNNRVIDELLIHHIGIATNDLERLTEEYLQSGYQVTNEVYDIKQKAQLRFLSKDNQVSIELIYTDDPESRVFNLSHNNYKIEYHTCFEVDNLKQFIDIFSNEGYLLITNIEKAELFDGKICFMYKNGSLIELTEII